MSKTFKFGNRYIGFTYGKYWNKEDLKLFYLMRYSYGWTLQIWKISIYYDNWNKIEGFKETIEK